MQVSRQTPVAGKGLCELLLIHTHCPTCGCPTTFEPEEDAHYNLNGGDRHVCIEQDTLICDCGALLARSRSYGWTWDRETGKPHLCPLDVDAIERELAFDRRSWSRQPITGWQIPLRAAAPGELEADQPIRRRVGRSFLP